MDFVFTSLFFWNEEIDDKQMQIGLMDEEIRQLKKKDLTLHENTKLKLRGAGRIKTGDGVSESGSLL